MAEVQGTRIYYATSNLTDPQTIFNFLTFIVACLQLPAFGAVVPAQYAPYVLLGVAVLSQGIRQFFTERPVAAISPGSVKPVEVSAVHETGTAAASFKPPAAMLLLVLLPVLLFSDSCAKRPPNLSPTGVRAWQADEVVVHLNTVVDATIGLNKVQVCQAPSGQPVNTARDCHPLVPDKTVRPVLSAIDNALQLLDKAPDNWRVIALQALDQAEKELDEYGKTKLLPYLAAARGAITAIPTK